MLHWSSLMHHAMNANAISIDPRRIRSLNKKNIGTGPVIYWMDRERRAHDNWSLLHAQSEALKMNSSLIVAYAIPKSFLDSTWRHHHFMIEGLKESSEELDAKNIPFFLLLGDPEKEIQTLAKALKASLVVTDFTPLRLPRSWRKKLSQELDMRLDEVDSRNIIPCWEASPKLEFAAYTFRPKVHKALPEFLTEIPKLKTHPHSFKGATQKAKWKDVKNFLKVDKKIPIIDSFKPGEKAAQTTLQNFLKISAKNYEENRNNPNENVLSNLSPYLHFGHISAQRVALEAKGHEVFLEELIVRRELSDNFCYYNLNYDKFSGFHEWAQKTLNEHRNDPRDFLYSLEEFEASKTHDPLWNAAQNEMKHSGKMHGYMRMYWAKKILEWSESPEEALRIAIKLNDRYELDGRDSNGYVGCAWSIGGVHDRAWGERPIFGKIRYMNAKGCQRKFDTESYIQKHTQNQLNF